MAFSFANMASQAASIGGQSQSGTQVQDGEELKEIQTAQLGFKTVNAEVKIRLLPSPWSLEDPPIPSAQLLSVASSQGILAAAGPDKLIIASTDKLRETLGAKEGENVRDITPIVTISQNRLTHIAFSSDDSALVIAGPDTGGIVAYQVDKLKSGQAEVALTINIPTPLRALVPNPNPATAHLFAVVTSEGLLLVADLSTGQLVQGSTGTALSQNIACVAWSNRGTQLVAGTTSATATQLKPDGQVVAHIPKSTSIPDDVHVSAVQWLENDTFFFIYTPNSTNATDGIPPSDYYIVERSNKTSYTLHKLPEVLPPFGVERLPTYHFIARLRKFDPHITDLLLLAATTATDIGMITKSNEPLSTSDNPEDLVANAFTFTSLEDDTRRAALPLSPETSMDTSPIGVAIDLSSKDSVINPLASDPEIQETVGPVPSLLVLNHEGLLCSWWIIYTDSVRQKTTFSGFDSLQAVSEIRSTVSRAATSESNSTQPNTTPTFGQAATPTSAAFSQPATATTASASSSTSGTPATGSVFGAAKLQPSFSSLNTGSGFGTASKIGEDKSSWTSTGFGASPATSSTPSASGQSGFGQSGLGQSTFGTPSAITSGSTPTFGAATTFGKPSAFGQPAAPGFGTTGFGVPPASSPFATTGGASAGSGFASFASSGGFGTSASRKPETTQSPFAKSVTDSGAASFAKPAAAAGSTGFGQQLGSESPFAKASGSGAFQQPIAGGGFGKTQGFGGFTNSSSKSPFSGGKPFKLESSFKGDGTAKDDLPAPTSGSTFGFDTGFGNLLGGAKKDAPPVQSTEAEMEDQETPSIEKSPTLSTKSSPEQRRTQDDGSKNFTTPPSTINQTKSTPAAPVSNLFGPPQQQTTTPQQSFGGTGFSFVSTTPKDPPAASNTFFGTKPTVAPTPALVQKSEPVMSFNAVRDVQSPQKKTENSFGQSNDTQKKSPETFNFNFITDTKHIPEAPLPPDPTSKPGYLIGDTSGSSSNSKGSKEPEDAPLPPDFLPANKSAAKEDEDVPLPDDEQDADEEEFESSDFAEDSAEDEDVTQEISPDVTQAVSPVREADKKHDNGEDATTEQIQTSPESSYKSGDATSPTGGLFTKVTTNDTSKIARPLFGEIGRSVPIFPPPKPKPQQSPRSPSPVRRFITHDKMRPDNRSVSAPIRSQSAIDQRKTEYSQSAIAIQAAKAREEEIARERAKVDAAKAAAERAKANDFQVLEDDETERILKELTQPIQPSGTLDEFITYHAEALTEPSKADIPAQIERLYQDINSMVCTLGINVRSLSSFMMHEKGQPDSQDWPDVLRSDVPMHAMSRPWFLNDIYRLREGSVALSNSLDKNQVTAVPQKLESCQALLTKDLFDLRAKITTIRKSLHARAHGSTAAAPLSAEQSSIQHDLRKASALVQTKLVQIEDGLAVMQARLSEVAPKTDTTKGVFGSQAKKPTVEAVTNTIAKMTSMAERKSADVDVLEAQLKKLDVSLGMSTNLNAQSTEYSTPRRSRTSRDSATPGSAASSVFYTPDSKANASARSVRSTAGNNISRAIVSSEDRDRWRAKAAKKKEVAETLKTILVEKRTKV